MKTYRHGNPEKAVVISCRLEEGPGHDRVMVWNRRGLAGTLTVNSGDGMEIVVKLLDGVAFGGPDDE